MTISGLTSTKEDYLRSIYYLEQKHSRSPRASEIASYLDLSKSSVTERLQDLAQHGYISYSRYGTIALEEPGRQVAMKLTTRHRIIEVFLHQVLGRPVEKLHDEAHDLEHAFSDESIEALIRLLGSPKKDPHGAPIDEY